MHGVCLLAPLSLRFSLSLYFQQVYSGYTLGFIYFIPNFDYDFLVRDLRFPNSEGTYVPKFQLPFQCCIWTVDLHKWEVRDGGGRLVEVSGAKKSTTTLLLSCLPRVWAKKGRREKKTHHCYSASGFFLPSMCQATSAFVCLYTW